MATLQKVNLGTPPTAVDGDTSRDGFAKLNANIDVLNQQAALTSASATITTAQALTAAHVGKRVNINLASAGTINVPSAAAMGLDGVVHLRNTGTTLITLAVASGSGDTIALTKLYGGESALLDSDGAHAIGCLMRGRPNTDSETVVGNSIVNGNETVGGTLSVTGAISANGGFSARPSFAGATPWDSSNLPSPVTLNTGQTLTGAKTFSSSTVFTGVWAGTWNTAGVILQGAGNLALSFSATNGNGQLYFSPGNAALNWVNGTNAAYLPIIASAFTVGSDRAFKSDISEIKDAMSTLRNMRGVAYTDQQGRRRVGLIAQEVQPHFPELIDELGMKVENDRAALGVNYAQFVSPLLQGLLETDAALRIALERIAALEAKAGA